MDMRNVIGMKIPEGDVLTISSVSDQDIVWRKRFTVRKTTFNCDLNVENLSWKKFAKQDLPSESDIYYGDIISATAFPTTEYGIKKFTYTQGALTEDVTGTNGHCSVMVSNDIDFRCIYSDGTYDLSIKFFDVAPAYPEVGPVPMNISVFTICLEILKMERHGVFHDRPSKSSCQKNRRRSDGEVCHGSQRDNKFIRSGNIY